jgi:hypothetical protein
MSGTVWIFGTFELALLGAAVLILGWGLERYRSRFVKADLLVAAAIAAGLVLLAVLPSVFDYVGSVLDLERRVVAVSFLANLGLLALLLYYASALRSVKSDVAELTRSLSVEQAPQTDGGRDEIFVVIPAYNEGDTIRDVVQSLPRTIRGYTVQPVVVSDGSADATAERAKYNGAMVVEHPLNQGQGGALQTGFRIASENDAAIVTTMDGDGQHPTDKLQNLVSPIIDDEADYVMGSRYVGTDRSDNGPVRKAGIRFFTALINILTKSSISDCTNGFRAIRGSMLESLTLTEERFSAPELVIEASKQGLRIEEIPITIEQRQAGYTKKPQLGYAIGLARTIMVTWAR